MPDGMPFEIPGYYYDPERQKYFRILPNHLAPRGGDFYTRSSVADLKADDKSKSEGNEVSQLEQSRTRFHHRRDPFLRASLFREVGAANREDVFDALRESQVRLLNRKRSPIVNTDREGIRCFDVKQPQEEGHSEVWFDVAWGGGSGYLRAGNFKSYQEDGESDREVTEISDISDISDLESAITSVTLSDNGWLLATTLGGASRPVVCIFGRGGDSIPFRLSYINTGSHSIWCSASAPTTPTTFAVGTSDGIAVVTLHSYGHIFETLPRILSDTFALSFIPFSPILLSAHRDGGIYPHDRRTDFEALPIAVNHGSIVSHLHPLSSHLVLAKGPQKCALYDLRYCHPPSPSAHFSRPTKAVQIYDELCDERGFSIDEGWAVSKRGDLMAGVVKRGKKVYPGVAGRRARSGAHEFARGDGVEIGVWSTVTGKRLRFGKLGEDPDGKTGKGKRRARGDEEGRVEGGNGSRGKDKDAGRTWTIPPPTKCIKFVEVPGIAGEEIWAATENKIVRVGACDVSPADVS